MVVARVRESRGPKNDQIDAFDLAEKLRIGAIKTRIYKKRATDLWAVGRTKPSLIPSIYSIRIEFDAP